MDLVIAGAIIKDYSMIEKCIESLPAKELEAVMEETRTEILDDQPTGNNIRNQIAAQRLK